MKMEIVNNFKRKISRECIIAELQHTVFYYMKLCFSGSIVEIRKYFILFREKWYIKKIINFKIAGKIKFKRDIFFWNKSVISLLNKIIPFNKKKGLGL